MFSHLRWPWLGFISDGLLGANIWLTITYSTKVFTVTVSSDDDPPHAPVLATANGERPPRPAYPTFTDGLWALTKRCWDQEAHIRPQASEVLRILLGLSVPLLDHTLLV